MVAAVVVVCLTSVVACAPTPVVQSNVGPPTQPEPMRQTPQKMPQEIGKGIVECNDCPSGTDGSSNPAMQSKAQPTPVQIRRTFAVKDAEPSRPTTWADSAGRADTVSSALKVETPIALAAPLPGTGPTVKVLPPQSPKVTALGSSGSAQGPSPNLPQSFYINVGSFAVAANAEAAYKKLLSAGLTATREEIETKKGTLMRVRLGPFDTKPQAAALVGKIHALKLDAVVVRK